MSKADISIEKIYEEKEKNPAMSFFEILMAYKEKYKVSNEFLVRFIQKEPTFFEVLKEECERLKLVKSPREEHGRHQVGEVH